MRRMRLTQVGFGIDRLDPHRLPNRATRLWFTE